MMVGILASPGWNTVIRSRRVRLIVRGLIDSANRSLDFGRLFAK